MYTGVHGEPDKYTILEFRYWRKAAIAMDNGHKIRHFIYRKLAKYYENKHLQKFLKKK